MADQKTEKPTQRRLKKSRDEGQFPVSRELMAGVQFLLLLSLMTVYASSIFTASRTFVGFWLRHAFDGSFTSAELTRSAAALGVGAIKPLGIALLALTLLPFVVHLVSTQFGIAAKSLAPSAGRLNPANRLRNIFSQNVPSALQAVLLLGLSGLFLWHALDQTTDLTMLSRGGLYTGIARLADALHGLLWKGGFLLFLFGVIDYVRQRQRWMKQLRMTKQEIREEQKDTDGNPEMKMRIRRLRRNLLRRQMMKEVPTATAVITNPTHYAIAIRYDMNSMTAPLVVAKGKNYLALRIRQKAMEHQVPIVENPPLAQALYKSAEVGQEIPAHLYRAVAEILAYIYRLMNGRLPG